MVEVFPVSFPSQQNGPITSRNELSRAERVGRSQKRGLRSPPDRVVEEPSRRSAGRFDEPVSRHLSVKPIKQHGQNAAKMRNDEANVRIPHWHLRGYEMQDGQRILYRGADTSRKTELSYQRR